MSQCSISCQNAVELERENDHLKQQVAMLAAEHQVHRTFLTLS